MNISNTLKVIESIRLDEREGEKKREKANLTLKAETP